MGQYHTVVAMDAEDVDDVATIDRERLGAGAKLSEQSYTWDPDVRPRCRIPSAYSAALGLMILGPWRRRRIAVIGDYSEPADDARCGYSGNGHLCDLYGVGRDDTDTAVALLAEATGFTSHRDEHLGGYIVSPDDLGDRLARAPRLDGYVITSTCGELIRPAALGSPANPMGSVLLGAAWPIVNVLCAISDGFGGGDFALTPPGRWANTAVAMPTTDDVPDGYLDVTDDVLQSLARHAPSWAAPMAAL
jgi:hypothetical protein